MLSAPMALAEARLAAEQCIRDGDDMVGIIFIGAGFTLDYEFIVERDSRFGTILRDFSDADRAQLL